MIIIIIYYLFPPDYFPASMGNPKREALMYAFPLLRSIEAWCNVRSWLIDLVAVTMIHCTLVDVNKF